MQLPQGPWSDPVAHLARTRPDHPVLYLSPERLQATARRFRDGFPGLVTYAVKANDRAEVLENLCAAGIGAFDVASPAEMAAVRAACPVAVLHYNNPVRSETEIAAGIAHGVASWSVDEAAELDKLAALPKGTEIAVRFALPVKGAAYDFGAKFGATPAEAARLLRLVAAGGWTPSLCFHPGTQCEDAGAWAVYIAEAARICAAAGVRIGRLNVGGGFAVDRHGRDSEADRHGRDSEADRHGRDSEANRHGRDSEADRHGKAPDLGHVFAVIAAETARAFGPEAPTLICEPGRAMVADAFTLATRVKALRRDGDTVFLNDGIYGGLTDLRDMGLTGRVRAFAADGTPRSAAPRPRVVFGPTCDSLDRLPDGLPLPGDLAVGDYVLFGGMGAYSVAMSTRFNGYGLSDVATVMGMAGH